MNSPDEGERRAHIAPSAHGGNGLFATEEVRPGELIFEIARPMLSVPDVAFLPETCSSCFTWVPKTGGATGLTVQHQVGLEGQRLKTCTSCKVVRYCDKTCQSNAWSSHHKYECKLFARLHPKVLPTAVRGVIRLLLLRSKGKVTDRQWSALTALTSHIDDFRKAGGERWEGICLMSKGAHAYSRTTFTEDFVRDLYCRTLINSLTLTTATFDPLGFCLDPLAASINHSCYPNAAVVFDGPYLCLRSLRKIEKDQEIYTSYVDCTYPTTRRQSELETRYFFTCACPKCKSLGPSPEDTLLCPNCNSQSLIDQTCSPCHVTDIPVLPDLSAIETRIFDMLDRGGHKTLDPGSAVLPLRNSLSILRETKVWPATRQPMPALHQHLAVDYVASEQWVLALEHMLKIYFDINPFLFPQPWHPVRVVHRWTLVNLVVLVADLSAKGEASVKELEPYKLDYGKVVWGLLYEVERNVDMSHGRESRFGGLVRRKVEEVRVDMARGSTGGPASGVDVSKVGWEEEWGKLREIARLAVK